MMFRNRCAASLLVCAHLLLTLASSAWSATGRTPGTFNVSATGAATYTIPIWAPAGPGGLQPQIALTYNSQEGNGIAGVGWNVSGIRSVYRCSLTYAQDGAPAAVALSTGDGLCMDGKRLRLTSGTQGVAGSTYQTEIADFNNVIAVGVSGNGPAAFQVQGRDGKTYLYGNTGDARVVATGTSTVSAWMLNEVLDRAGNTMTFAYTTATGATVPNTISWTPTSHGATSYAYTMVFGYGSGAAPPQSSRYGYVAGTAIVNTNLLKTIAVNYGGVVKEYFLSYQASPTTGRSQLSQIKECADSAQSNCLAPTVISYPTNDTEGVAGVNSLGTYSTGGQSQFISAYDLNGDGRNDLVWYDTGGWHVAFATSTGFSAPVSAGIPGNAIAIESADGSGVDGILAPVSGAWYYYKWNGSSFVGTSTGIATTGSSTVANSFALADLNGDGLPDFITTGTDGYLYVRLHTSNTASVSFSNTSTKTAPNQAGTGIQSFFNGTRHLDFYGSGQQDLVSLRNAPTGPTGEVFHFNGTTLVDTGPLGSFNGPVDLADYNDDGCTDALSAYGLQISACNGQPTQEIGFQAMAVGAMDWDGDGRRDILVANGGTLGVYKSWGYGPSTTITPTLIPYSPGMQSQYATVHNATGDGLDAIAIFNSSSSYAAEYFLHNGSGQPPDLVTSITDGYGNSSSPTYVSIAQANYTIGTGIRDGYRNYVGPMYVCNKVTFSDPTTVSGSYNLAFYYSNAWMSLQGRGFTGFQEVQRNDSRTGLWENRWYNFYFPYIGNFVWEQIAFDQAGNQPIISNWVEEHALTLDGTANNQRYFVYNDLTDHAYQVSWSTSTGSSPGPMIKTIQTTFQYDNYGNATSVATTTTDNDANSPYFGQTWTQTTTNTPDVDTANWCLTLPLTTQIVYSASNATPATPVTQTKNFTPDTVNCRINSVVTQPSSATYKVTEDLVYDSFGNVKNDTVTGVGMAARLTTIDWGATGQFPSIITDPSGAINQVGYDLRFGLPSSVTDANGLPTSWAYTDGFGRLNQETRPDGTYTTLDYQDCTTAGGCLFGGHTIALAHHLHNKDATVQSDGTTFLDALERRVVDTQVQLDGSYVRSDYRYDSLGRMVTQSAPCTYMSLTTLCPYMTTNAYDLVNRITQISHPISASNSTLQTTTYTFTGDTTVTTDPYGKQTTKISTAIGTLLRSQDNNGYYQNFAYDAQNNLSTVTDSLGHTLLSLSYGYGTQPFLTSATDIDSGSWSKTYDALGELTAWSDPKGQNVSASYDVLSRMTDRYEKDLYSHWQWGTSATAHEIGKLHSTCSGLGTNPTTCTASPGYSETESYDSFGRKSQQGITIPSDPTPSYTYTWQYDANSGLLANLTYPTVNPGTAYALKVQYGYAHGILSSITDVADSPNVAIWTANTLNPRGQVTQETLGNGVIVNRNFDAVTGFPGSIQAGKGGGTALQNQSYLFDEMGNLIQRQDNNRTLTESFCYDSIYRLDHSTLTGSCSDTTNLQMVYDQLGNITKKSDVATTTWTYDATHVHQVRTAGSNSYTYDANGNMITYQAGGSPIQWNSANYPTLLTFGGSTDNISYNQNRDRYYQKFVTGGTTETTYFAGKLLEKVTETSGAVDWRYYVFAGGSPVALVSRQNSATAISYILRDHLGSTAAFLNSAGAAQVNESFRAFGVERSPTDWVSNTSTADTNTIAGISRHGYTFESTLTNPGTFSGMMVHLNGRVLDGFIGRMLSADPVIPDIGNTQDFNRYSYARNNPLTLIDPSGFDSCFSVGGTTDDGGIGEGYVTDNPDDGGLPEVGVFSGGYQVCIPDLNPGLPGGVPAVPGGGGAPSLTPPTLPRTGPSHRPTQNPHAPPAAVPPNSNNEHRGFPCLGEQEDPVKSWGDNLSNVGSAADSSKPLVTLAASAAGASRSLSSPQAVSFLGNSAAGALSKIGKIGEGGAFLGIFLDVYHGDVQSAIFDFTDYVVYKNLAEAGIEGGAETGGAASAAALAAGVLYYNAGGAKGMFQSFAGCPIEQPTE